MDIQEVVDLKKQVEEDFRKDTEAIDRVLALLERRKVSEKVQDDDSSELPPEQPSSKIQSKDDIPIVQPTTRKIDFAEDEESPSVATNGNLNGNKFGRARDSGVKGVAKQTIPFLDDFFTRKELLEKMEEKFPEWRGKLTKDAMNGAVKRLLEDDLIAVHTRLGGKNPIVYRKVEST